MVTTDSTTGSVQTTGTPPTLFAVLSPADVAELQKYTKSDLVLKYPDILKMLYETPSLSIKEKVYWLQLLALMNDEQVQKLRGILTTEKKKLMELNRKYEQDIESIARDSARMTPAEAAARAQKLRHAERAHEEQKEEQEEALLSSLDHV